MKPTLDEFRQYYEYDAVLKRDPEAKLSNEVLNQAAKSIDSMCRCDFANPEYIDTYLHPDSTTQGLCDFFGLIDGNAKMEVVWKEFCTLNPSEMGAAIKIMLMMV